MTNNTDPVPVLEAVARAICVACEENPDHQGDARGNEFRWQDYVDTARAAIQAIASAPPSGGELPPEDRFEQFVQAEIARSPDALRELGEYLSDRLDEDQWPRANALLLQLATEYAPQRPAAVDGAILQEAGDVLEAVGVSGVPLPDNWRWPLADELHGMAAALAANRQEGE